MRDDKRDMGDERELKYVRHGWEMREDWGCERY